MGKSCERVSCIDSVSDIISATRLAGCGSTSSHASLCPLATNPAGVWRHAQKDVVALAGLLPELAVRALGKNMYETWSCPSQCGGWGCLHNVACSRRCCWHNAWCHSAYCTQSKLLQACNRTWVVQLWFPTPHPILKSEVSAQQRIFLGYKNWEVCQGICKGNPPPLRCYPSESCVTVFVPLKVW